MEAQRTDYRQLLLYSPARVAYFELHYETLLAGVILLLYLQHEHGTSSVQHANPCKSLQINQRIEAHFIRDLSLIASAVQIVLFAEYFGCRLIRAL